MIQMKKKNELENKFNKTVKNGEEGGLHQLIREKEKQRIQEENNKLGIRINKQKAHVGSIREQKVERKMIKMNRSID